MKEIFLVILFHTWNISPKHVGRCLTGAHTMSSLSWEMVSENWMKSGGENLFMISMNFLLVSVWKTVSRLSQVMLLLSLNL